MHSNLEEGIRSKKQESKARSKKERCKGAGGLGEIGELRKGQDR